MKNESAVQFETDKPWQIYSTEAGFALAHVDTEANARVIAASWDMWFELQRLHRLYGHEQTSNVLATIRLV